MKPVNRILADEFHRASEEGVEAVLARMFEVAGNKIGFSYAEIFDVSENTIKTWRRRGAVSTKFLQGFAREHGTSLDYLLYGRHSAAPPDRVLSDSERDLIEAYRAASKQLRDAAVRVLRGEGAGGVTQNIGNNQGQVTGTGKIVVKRGEGRRK